MKVIIYYNPKLAKLIFGYKVRKMVFVNVRSVIKNTHSIGLGFNDGTHRIVAEPVLRKVKVIFNA